MERVTGIEPALSAWEDDRCAQLSSRARLRLHGGGAREVDPVLLVGSFVAPHGDSPSVRANSL